MLRTREPSRIYFRKMTGAPALFLRLLKAGGRGAPRGKIGNKLMPWINGGQIDDRPLTVCGSCAQTMERYVVSRHQGDVVVVAERCVHCLTQFHLKPEPDQVGFGSIPPTGSIKWEKARHEKPRKKKRQKRTHEKSQVLESSGIRS